MKICFFNRSYHPDLAANVDGAALPAGVDLQMAFDGSVFVRRSILEAQETLLITAGLVILIIGAILWATTVGVLAYYVGEAIQHDLLLGTGPVGPVRARDAGAAMAFAFTSCLAATTGGYPLIIKHSFDSLMKADEQTKADARCGAGGKAPGVPAGRSHPRKINKPVRRGSG